MKYWSGVVGTVLFSFLLVGAVAATPTYVIGNVVDADNVGIEDATVSATCGGVTKQGITGSDGEYGIDFTGVSSCTTGTIASVTASYGDQTGTNTGPIEGFIVVEIATVNVSMIPEFPTVMIPAVLALGGYIVTRRNIRKE